MKNGLRVGEVKDILNKLDDDMELVLDDEFGILGITIAMNADNEPMAFIERIDR